MQVHIDSGRCQGHARCHAVAPQVYDLDDLGYAQVSPDPVPVDLEAAAHAGAAACPERALTLAHPSAPSDSTAPAIAPHALQETP